MRVRYSLTLLGAVLMLGLAANDCPGRGRGGGGRGGMGGGVRGGVGGGGFGGGVAQRPAGPSGLGGSQLAGSAARGPGGLGGVGGGGLAGLPLPGRGGLGGPGVGGLGSGGGNLRGAATPGAAGVGGRGAGASGNRYAAPSRSQLAGFLGMPSDEGLHALGGGSRSTASQLPASGNRGENLDVNYGTAEGPRGGQAAGATVTGPRGNTYGRAAGVGAEGGAASVRGVQGAGGGAAVRGAGVGPGGRAAAGRAVRGPGGGVAAGGVAAGPRGAAAGFARVSPSGRYTCGAAVRRNYTHWGLYGANWYAAHPGAWYAAGLAAGAAWDACAWDQAASYCGYADSQPVYYDYGDNVTYQDGNVYVEGQDAGTSEQYYDQASDLASSGAQADAPSDGDWLPLGVFALTKPDRADSDDTIQLAVDKQGIIRGNCTDVVTKDTKPVQGSVDKSTQRVAFTVGDNTETVLETGLYNLTKDEGAALIHFGADRTEQWLLVRLKQPDTSQNQQ